MRRSGLALLAVGAAAAAGGLAACGGSSGGSASSSTRTVTVERVVTTGGGGSGRGFNAEGIYRRVAPQVVTVLSVFPGGALSDLLGGGGGGAQEAIGSGFVVSKSGEIVTNAHVVTNGSAGTLKRAKQVFVQFADGNQVPAKILGADPSEDVALLKIDPKNLNLDPLQLGTTNTLAVGAPVAAIGSPFDEPQSLSVGVVSGLNRTLDSLDGKFQITGAVQTDAAINHGNSGGPLVDGRGRVLGINSQIQSSSGGGDGVGFAVPVDAVKQSIAQLRDHGHVRYGYLGVTTVPMYPQLAARFHLPVGHGAWIQQVSAGAPAAKSGLKGGHGGAVFQTQPYRTGGDLIVSVDGHPLQHQDDLSQLIAQRPPGQVVTLTVYSGSRRHDVKVKLAPRPVPAG